MKRWLILIFFINLQNVQHAFAGWEHGNAGDSYAAEFIMTAKDILIKLKTLPYDRREAINLDHFTGVLENTTVRTEEVLKYIDGKEVEAINYPDQKLILLNRTLWRTRRTSSETLARYTFVLHEYLGIMRIDDSQYKISGPIISLLNLNNYNPSVWWTPMNPTNYIGLNLIYNNGSCQLSGSSLSLNKNDEMILIETNGTCGDDYRKIMIAKSSGTAPPSSSIRGTFHKFQIAIFNKNNTQIGQFNYEPEWGSCLGPQEGTCYQSGKIISNDIEFIFMLKPN
ncbi:MAG: hypothetical protein ACK41T_02715 [Pseudobdellovibrio sp.]